MNTAAPFLHPLWLCLHLPALPLEALGPWPPGVSLPMLVWRRDPGGGRTVEVVNAAARQRGISAGQALATAQALAPEVLILDRRPDREDSTLHRLALRLGTLTPHLVVDPPDVLLELRACLRLFGGVRPLIRQATRHTLEAGLTPATGMAPTPLAARLLARTEGRHARHALQPTTTHRRLWRLPLSALLPLLPPQRQNPRTQLEMLHALGLRTLGDLARLPSAGLHRRGGAPWLNALARAEGRTPDPLPWFAPPPEFHQRLSLNHPADTLDQVGHAAQHLLHALCGWLHLHWRAAQRLELVMHHEHGARRTLPEEVLQLDLSQPSRDIGHLGTVLHEHLQRHPLCAAVDALELRLLASRPDHGQALSLLPGAPGEDTTAQAALIDRLCARLGPDAVLRLQPQADARPEKADRADTAQATASRVPGSPQASDPRATPGANARPRPTWLLDPPRALVHEGEFPHLDGQPLQLLTRAERIESGWHDGALVRRDYHVALAADGRLHWVYLAHPQRRTGAPDDTPRWFLHGHFG